MFGITHEKIVTVWKWSAPVFLVAGAIATLVIFAQVADLRRKTHEIESVLKQNNTLTLAQANATSHGAGGGKGAWFAQGTPEDDAAFEDRLTARLADLYEKITNDKSQIFYQGVGLSVQLQEEIFGEGDFGGLSRGSVVNPAIISYGPVYVRGPIVLDGDTGDIKIFRAGRFVSLSERLGLGNPERSTPSPSPSPSPGMEEWTHNLCRGAVVGQSCPNRHNWGVDSCVRETNTSILCYCGGGYRDDITGIVHRHFLCNHAENNPSSCLALFADTSPRCCSPTDASNGCASDTPTETPCAIALDHTECCDGLDETRCLAFGCMWTPLDRTCTFPEVEQKQWTYADLYAKCTSYLSGSMCDYQSRDKYLALYNDIEGCKAAGTGEQACLLNARDRVNNAHWPNITVTNLYNWFDSRRYAIRNHAMQRPCLYGYLSLSKAAGSLRNAYPAVWGCERKEAVAVTFRMSPFEPERDYFTEQGRVGYVLTRPPGAHTFYCLSAPMTREYNITYHATHVQSSDVLWLDVLDAEDWTMCAKVSLPVTLDTPIQARVSSLAAPLGFDRITHGVRYTNSFNIAVEQYQ